MQSRLKHEADKIFEVFISLKKSGNENNRFDPDILQTYPTKSSYINGNLYENEENDVKLDKKADKEKLKKNEQYEGMVRIVPRQAFVNDFQEIEIEYFTFTMTDLEGFFKFVYYRRKKDECFCIVSNFPWHDFFYSLLNKISEASNDEAVILTFLKKLYLLNVPQPEGEVIVYTGIIDICFKRPHCEDRNLLPTHPSSILVTRENLIKLFCSMMSEQRILIVSDCVSRLTAFHFACASLLYPLFWQHTFTSILIPEYFFTISQPSPFLIGITSTQFKKLATDRDFGHELEHLVILHIDYNSIRMPSDYKESMPKDLIHVLNSSLKKIQSDDTYLNIMNDEVSRPFMELMISLIGDYKSGYKKPDDGEIFHDEETFIQAQNQNHHDYLRILYHQSQMFVKFLDERVEVLNRGGAMDTEFDQNARLSSNHEMNKFSSHMIGKTFMNLQHTPQKMAKIIRKIPHKNMGRFYRSHASLIRFQRMLHSRADITKYEQTQIPADKVLSPETPSILSRYSAEKVKSYRQFDLEDSTYSKHKSGSSQKSFDTDYIDRFSNSLMNDPDVLKFFPSSSSLDNLKFSDSESDDNFGSYDSLPNAPEIKIFSTTVSENAETSKLFDKSGSSAIYSHSDLIDFSSSLNANVHSLNYSVGSLFEMNNQELKKDLNDNTHKSFESVKIINESTYRKHSYNQEDLFAPTTPTIPMRNSSLCRTKAFYNTVRPSSYHRQDSIDTLNARKSFLEKSLSKISLKNSLEEFDPFSNGQIAYDKSPSVSGDSDQSINSASSTNAQDENLLKEWNIDFKRIKVTPSISSNDDVSEITNSNEDLTNPVFVSKPNEISNYLSPKDNLTYLSKSPTTLSFQAKRNMFEVDKRNSELSVSTHQNNHHKNFSRKSIHHSSIVTPFPFSTSYPIKNTSIVNNSPQNKVNYTSYIKSNSEKNEFIQSSEFNTSKLHSVQTKNNLENHTKKWETFY